jgi:succinate-acetate transporter protein
MAATIDAPPAAAATETASGVPLCVFAFGFSVMALSFANAGWVDGAAGLFVPVAFGTGALGMLVGGLWEFRGGNLFGATFGVGYACFLFTTPMILRWFAPEVSDAAKFGDSFGVYLLMWAVFTAFMTFGAYYVNLPAFLAFLLLVIVYLLAGVVNIAGPEGTTLLRITGWVGILDGLCAWWVGFGLVLNGMGPKPVIPLIPYPYGK